MNNFLILLEQLKKNDIIGLTPEGNKFLILKNPKLSEFRRFESWTDGKTTAAIFIKSNKELMVFDRDKVLHEWARKFLKLNTSQIIKLEFFNNPPFLEMSLSVDEPDSKLNILVNDFLKDIAKKLSVSIQVSLWAKFIKLKFSRRIYITSSRLGRMIFSKDEKLKDRIDREDIKI